MNNNISLQIGDTDVPLTTFENVVEFLKLAKAQDGEVVLASLLIGAESDKPFRILGPYGKYFVEEGVSLGILVFTDKSRVFVRYADKETRAVVRDSVTPSPAFQITPRFIFDNFEDPHSGKKLAS